jgi:hypothetical protein
VLAILELPLVLTRVAWQRRVLLGDVPSLRELFRWSHAHSVFMGWAVVTHVLFALCVWPGLDDIVSATAVTGYLYLRARFTLIRPASPRVSQQCHGSPGRDRLEAAGVSWFSIFSP